MSDPMLLALVWGHFLADFLMQTDKMALEKSQSWKWLTIHVALYTACFLGFGLKFMLITFIAHFITDAISSRLTAYLWHKNQRHWFFVVVGADQALHMTQLFITYEALK